MALGDGYECAGTLRRTLSRALQYICDISNMLLNDEELLNDKGTLMRNC